MAVATAMLVGACNESAYADEGGVSFWLPGFYGSLSAVPGTPGWSFSGIYYHSSVKAGAGQDIPLNGRIAVELDGQANLGFFGSTYVFDEQLFGGRPSLSLLGAFGQSVASVSAQLTRPDGTKISGQLSDTLTGFGDLIPQASLAWNQGTNNFMTYVTGDIPIGAYNPNRLANLGLGHSAIDAGDGYTYLNPENGLEFSAVTGFTYNFTNTDLNYKNGIDWHLDWGFSKFVSKELLMGVVGYAFQQVSGDSGSGATLGPFQSRDFGIGPQIGFFIPVGEMKGYINLKGYGEFATANRPSGWNLWLTFALTPGE
jgi:hypothetical protein